MERARALEVMLSGEDYDAELAERYQRKRASVAGGVAIPISLAMACTNRKPRVRSKPR
jgi:hypothetical protein